MVSRSSSLMSEELCVLINPSISAGKLIKSEKTVIENLMRELAESR